jgi:RNA polymerase sigma-B factor
VPAGPRDVQPMSQRSDAELLAAYQRDRDPRVRAALVERYLPFARKLALRYRHTREPIEDLVQVASLGLLQAIDRYDPARGPRFSSFAAPTILGELKRHFRDKTWAVRVPRELQEHALALSHGTERHQQDVGRPPTIPELAASLGWSIEAVLEAHEVSRSYEASSLDAPVDVHDQDLGAALIDLIGDQEDGFELAESRDAISREWMRLSALERQVISLRLNENLTQRQIGERVGCSQMQVSRVLRRALARLEAAVAADAPSAPTPAG